MQQIVTKNHYCVVNLQKKLKLYLRGPIPIFLSWKMLFCRSRIYPCHCVKSVQTRSFSWSVLGHFSCSAYEKHLQIKSQNLQSKYPHSVRIRENRGQKNILTWILLQKHKNGNCRLNVNTFQRIF